MSQFELHNAGNTEAQQKEAMAYLLSQASTGKAATGVLSGLAVAQTTTASGSVTVGAGAGVVQAAVLDGASVLVNDSAYTLDVFTANPMSSLPRNDIVVFDASTITVRVIIGTTNATPTDPTVPTSAIRLARLRNAASATTIPTSAIDDLRTFTSLALPKTPMRSLYRNVAQTIPASTETAITGGWSGAGADGADQGDACGITYSNGILTVPTAGLYDISVGLYYSTSNAVGTRIVMVGKNGTANKVLKGGCPAGSYEVAAGRRQVSLAAGDTLQVIAYQGSGASGSVTAALESYWQVRYIGPA